MNRRKLFISTAKAAVAAAGGSSVLSSIEADAQPASAAETRNPEAKPVADGAEIPRPSPPFKGMIGKTFKDSKQDFPQPFKAPKGAPNVLVILLDDVGFGHPGTFGGPIPTPKLDELAGEGLRYNTFHSTGICSPTRAAVLTGLNHHQVGFGTIAELSTGYPGYDSVWPLEAATVAEVLKQNGYSTAAWGKWHNTPDWETTPDGAVQPLADRRRLRILVRVPRRRDEPVGAATLPQHAARRAAEAARAGLSSDRRHRRRRDRLDQPREVDHAGQAVLRLFRARRGSRAPARAEGMDRQVQGPVRSGLGQGQGRDAGAPEGARRRAGRHAADAPAKGDRVLGQPVA